jgi:hypothetical protein
MVGDDPRALVRLAAEADGERFVREIVRLTPEPENPVDLLQPLSTHLKTCLVAELPPRQGGGRSEGGTLVHRVILPWPGADDGLG